jgi:hypothetical protein
VVEIANGVEAVEDGRIYIERVNAPFLSLSCRHSRKAVDLHQFGSW